MINGRLLMINHEGKSQSSPPSPAPFLLSQPNSWDSASLGCSQLGQWWAPDPRGGLWQSESFPHVSEPIVMGPEPVNGKEILSRGRSWHCGRLKLPTNLKTNFFFFFCKKLQKFMWREMQGDAWEGPRPKIYGPTRDGRAAYVDSFGWNEQKPTHTN